MANVVVIGAQWGDEGKGKIVDWLSERADIVVRFQGGHNAGHTLVIGNETYKLALLPSGVVRPGKLSVIGNGVVLDPWHLIVEIDALKKRGIDIDAAQPEGRRERHADPAAASRARPAARGGSRRAADRHHRARHRAGLRGQGRAARHPRPGSQEPRHAGPQGRPPARAPQRAAARAGRRRDRQGRADARAHRDRAEDPALRGQRLVAARRASAARASASCSRARRARCSTSTTAPIPSSPPPTRWRRRRRPARAWGRAPSATCWASPRPTPRASAPGPFPTELTDEIGELLGERGQEFGVNTGPQAPLRLVRRLPGAPGDQGVRASTASR